MSKVDYEKVQELQFNYLLRKYGRVSIFLVFIFIILLEFTGVRSNITSDMSNFNSVKNSVAIRGSKKVNPSVKDEYWTSNKFDF